MNRRLTPYEKNQLLKYGQSTQIEEDNQIPVEYLTGHVDFLGHDFLVTHHTLIPRVETGEIVDLVLSHIQATNYKLPATSIADVATGSGALGISLSNALLAKNLIHKLYLSDISLEALTTARLNALRLLPSSINPAVIQSDLFSSYPAQTFDIITANLPYIPTERIATLDTSVKDFEPHLALDGGPTGAELINRLISDLPRYTQANSLVILEIDHTHTLESFDLPAIFEAEIIPDSYGQTRFLKLIRHTS